MICVWFDEGLIIVNLLVIVYFSLSQKLKSIAINDDGHCFFVECNAFNATCNAFSRITYTYKSANWGSLNGEVDLFFCFLTQEGDAIDEELDKQEILEPGNNELAGEELLEKEYVVVSARTKLVRIIAGVYSLCMAHYKLKPRQ